MKGKGTPIRPTHPRTVKTLQQQKEKKPEVPTAGVPKIAKPPTKRPEIFELQKSLPTSLETFSDLVGAFNNGTDELRRLLDFECEFIFECRVCRNLFRSLSNFIQHKRAYCFDRFKELKRKFDFNGEVVDKVVQLNGSSPKGAVVSTRKTMRKDIYEVLKKVGNFTEEISPAEHLYTKNIEKTEAALHTFFHQEGKAPTEERSATLGPDGTIISSHPFPLTDKGTATEPHPALRPATSTTGGQSERRTDVNSLKCINCNATFGSVSELNLHSSSRACSQLRCYHTCPICQKAVHSPYSVYRHLRRVHSKSLDQIQKLRDKIRKKFMKDPRPWKNKNRSTSPAAEVKSSAPSPNTAKRTHLTESSSPVKTIVEVRHYNKSPIRPELSLPALMRKQPLVVLTKTAIPHSMTSFSLTNASDPAASTDESNPSTSLLQNDTSDSRSQSDSPSQPKLLQPPKRARVEKDLSWLKRGPTAPVVEGARLTRTARALYGSPKKSLSNGELPEKMTIADENEVSENGGKTESPCRSNDNMADHRGASISDDTDGEDPKGDDDGESLDSAFINKRLSSSEDNVQMMASSSRMCNVSPTKAEGEKMDVNDRGSTSGIETDLSPEVDQVTPSQSDDESEDVDRLVNIYQTSPPPTKMSLCNRPSSADRVSDSGSFGSVEDNGTTSDERSCIVRLKNSKITKAPTSAPDSPSRRDHIKPIYVNRTEDEDVDSGCTLVRQVRSVAVKRRFEEEDQTDSEECTEERQADDALRHNMMDIIFGSLPTSSFKGLSQEPLPDVDLSS